MGQSGLRLALVILALLSAAAVARAAPASGPEPLDYADPAHWICRPGRDDVCGRDLSATVVEADGALTVQPLEADPDAAVDCFYIYPTVSRDKSLNADTNWGEGEELWATSLQAAPLAGGCRIFAPGYRQLTIDGLSTHALPNDVAYGDVLAAWRYYRDHDNQGRGVVLVGHSQGSWTIRKLIASEIDGNEAARSRLVAAYLAGFSLQVPPGADVGGDFSNIPLCRANDQVGCVIAWATYRSSSPPPVQGFPARRTARCRAASSAPTVALPVPTMS